MGQKTDTIDRQDTRTNESYGSTTDEPPTWNELSKKADADQKTKNTLALSAVAVALGFLLPIGSWGVAVFITALAGSSLGVGDTTSGALSGALVLGLTSFLGSVLLTIISLGTITVLPAVVIGLILGGVGGFLGSKIRKTSK